MIHIWRVNEKSQDDNEQPCEKNPLKLNDAVTAVTFASRLIEKEKFVTQIFFSSLQLVNESFLFYLDIFLSRDLIMVEFFSMHGMNKYPGNY
jgi:hypothetical protein